MTKSIAARSGPSRRRVLATSAAAVVGVGATYAAGRASAPAEAAASPDGFETPIDFHGMYQAGIVTPAQDRIHFVALDVVTKDRDELAALLQVWTRAAERMTLGAEAAPGGLVGGGLSRVPRTRARPTGCRRPG